MCPNKYERILIFCFFALGVTGCAGIFLALCKGIYYMLTH
jgi:hypothetical protein